MIQCCVIGTSRLGVTVTIPETLERSSLGKTVILRLTYLDREYVALPTANHYVNTNQRSSRTNNAIHYVTILP